MPAIRNQGTCWESEQKRIVLHGCFKPLFWSEQQWGLTMLLHIGGFDLWISAGSGAWGNMADFRRSRYRSHRSLKVNKVSLFREQSSQK